MGVAEWVKSVFNRSPATVRYEVMKEMGNAYFSWGGKLYENDIVRACVKAHATAIGKLQLEHIGEGKNYGFIDKIIEEPNPYMSMQMLQERLAGALILNRNAFAYINRSYGYPIEIYPLSVASAQAIYDKSGYLFLRFSLNNGQQVTYPYTDIIHLRKDYYSNDIFGISAQEALTPLMEIITTSDSSIVNAVHNSAVIRWLLKLSQNLKDKDVKKKAMQIEEDYLQQGRSILAIDSSAEIQQIKPTDYVPESTQANSTLERVYGFFGVNDNIVHNKFTEDEWTAFYEAEIEPVARQLSDEFTRKLFTPRDRADGHRLIFSANNLTYTSAKTKLEMQAMVDRGALTPNEWRAILNLPPVEDGDKPLRRLDTVTVSETKENE